MSDEVWHLYWRDRPVCLLRGVECGDWPFLDAAFDPGEFPKDLADALAWCLARLDDSDDSDDAAWPNESVLSGWSVLEPNGRRTDASIAQVNFVSGSLVWR